METQPLKLEDLRINQTVYFRKGNKTIKGKVSALNNADKYSPVCIVFPGNRFGMGISLDKVMTSLEPMLIIFKKRKLEFLGSNWGKFMQLMSYLLAGQTLVYEGKFVEGGESVNTKTKVTYSNDCDKLVLLHFVDHCSIRHPDDIELRMKSIDDDGRWYLIPPTS
jgi:hypothetical protein